MVRLKAALGAGLFYAKWYPKQWLPIYNRLPKTLNKKLKHQLKYVRKTSKKLARVLFHSMLKHGPKLDKQQLLLGRVAEIGTELFIITAVAMRTSSRITQHGDSEELLPLTECIFNRSKNKIDALCPPNPKVLHSAYLIL